MRALVVITGVGMALAGFAVVCHQMLLWQQDGYWKPIPFGVLWVALGGAAPDLLDVHGIGGIMAWLMAQPLKRDSPAPRRIVYLDRHRGDQSRAAQDLVPASTARLDTRSALVHRH